MANHFQKIFWWQLQALKRWFSSLDSGHPWSDDLELIILVLLEKIDIMILNYGLSVLTNFAVIQMKFIQLI